MPSTLVKGASPHDPHTTFSDLWDSLLASGIRRTHNRGLFSPGCRAQVGDVIRCGGSLGFEPLGEVRDQGSERG